MELSPVPARAAPGFTLTDQDGRVRPLSAFRGKVEPGRRRLALSVDGGRGPPGPGRAG
jgi:hypothetical protein